MTQLLPRPSAVWPILCLLTALACGSDEGAKPPSAALKVRLAEATPAVIEESAAFDAVLAAKETVEVRAKIRGYLQERLFEEGTVVSRDAPLYRLDDRDLKAEYEAARANTAQTEATWKNDEANMKRYLALAETGSVSLQDRDNAVARAEASHAVYQATRAKEELAAVNLGYAVITAPLAGFIDRSLLDAGALVEAGSTLLTTIYRLDPIRAEFAITDREYAFFKQAMEKSGPDASGAVRFRLYLGDDRQSYPHEGSLEMADPVVDPKTNTLGVRAVFPNPLSTLRPGLFVNLVGILGQREVVTVPDEAVVDTGQGGKAVFIVDEKSTLATRPVTIGHLDGERRVILEGLEPGRKVVVEGLVTAQPGMPVEVVEESPTY